MSSDRTVPFSNLPWNAPLSDIGCNHDPYLVTRVQKDKDCDFQGVTFSHKTERCPLDKRASCIFQVESQIGLGKTAVNPYAVCSAVKFKPTKKKGDKGGILAPGPVATRWTSEVLDTYTKKQLQGWVLYTMAKDKAMRYILEEVYLRTESKDIMRYILDPTVKLLEKPDLIRTILLYNWGRKPKIDIPIRCVQAR